jgi:hypothetical protein
MLPVLPAAKNAVVRIDTAYPFGDTARITVTAPAATLLHVRIPNWANNATVNGTSTKAGAMAAVPCPAGKISFVVDLAPTVQFEQGE